jgi:hypothetical protein
MSRIVRGRTMVMGLLVGLFLCSKTIDAQRPSVNPSSEGVSLVFAGDALFGRSFSENKDPEMIRLFEIFRSADAAFINMEQVYVHSWN